MSKSRIEANDMKFHLSSSIGSQTHAPVLYPADYASWVIHMEDYVADMEDADII